MVRVLWVGFFGVGMLGVKVVRGLRVMVCWFSLCWIKVVILVLCLVVRM